MYSFLICVFSFLVAANALTGGKDASIQDFPHYVAIHPSRRGCGGAILSKDWVVTNAQCLIFFGSGYYYVEAGIKESSSNTHAIEKVLVHRNYKLGVPTNDIALVKVKDPFQLDETRKPIELFDGKLKSGMLANVTRLERFEKYPNTVYYRKGDRNAYNRLQSLEVPLVNCAGDYTCGEFSDNHYDKKVWYCNPLVVDGKLAGITSGKYKNVAKLMTIVDIAYHRDWIQRNLNSTEEQLDARVVQGYQTPQMPSTTAGMDYVRYSRPKHVVY